MYIELRTNYVQTILDQILSCKKMLYLFLKLFNMMIQINTDFCLNCPYSLQYICCSIHTHVHPSFILSWCLTKTLTVGTSSSQNKPSS